MIFSRNRMKRPPALPKPSSGLQGDDDVMDIAKSMVGPEKPTINAAASKPMIPMSAKGGPGPMYFGGPQPQTPTYNREIQRPTGPIDPANLPKGPGQRTVDAPYPTDPKSKIRAQADKAAAIARAKEHARRDMQDKAANNAREVADGIDYNGDGVIGTGIEGMAGGRQMTNEDLINTAIRDFLEPIDNTGARSAADEALRQNIAESRLNARARGGMAGMGLTGATAAMEGTEARRGERERTLTMDEFDRRARQEQMDRSLAGIGAERESEVFKRLMGLLDEEDDASKTDEISRDNVVQTDEKDSFVESISAPEGGGKMLFSEDPNDPYVYYITDDTPPKRIKVKKEDVGLEQSNLENNDEGFWAWLSRSLGG